MVTAAEDLKSKLRRDTESMLEEYRKTKRGLENEIGLSTAERQRFKREIDDERETILAEADAAPTTAPDFYLGPEASLDHIEQLLFSFLPASLVEEEADHDQPYPDAYPDQFPADNELPYDSQVYGRPTDQTPRSPRTRPEAAARPSIWTELLAQLRTGPAAIGMAYLGIYVAAEVLAAGIDARLGLVVHAGLLLAIFFHGANVPPGPERTFFWTLWLAPLTRIYGLAQPYAGAPLLTWWALTTIPMVVAGVVAMRLVGMSAREAGLIPKAREAPVAIFMVPVGLAIGVIVYMLLDPRTLAASWRLAASASSP